MTPQEHATLKADFLRALAGRPEEKSKFSRVLDLLLHGGTEWPRRGIYHYPARHRMRTEGMPFGVVRYIP